MTNNITPIIIQDETAMPNPRHVHCMPKLQPKYKWPGTVPRHIKAIAHIYFGIFIGAITAGLWMPQWLWLAGMFWLYAESRLITIDWEDMLLPDPR